LARKSKNSDENQKPKNLTSLEFLGFLKKLKKPRFLKMGIDNPGGN